MSERARPHNDDGYFEELTRAIFLGNPSSAAVEAKWPGFRRAFSKFSVSAVADYTPEDVDRLMSDPEIVRSLKKIEATIENAGEILLLQIEHGSFAEYCDAFETQEELIEDITRRFRQIDTAAAAAFVARVAGPGVSAA